MDQIATIEFVKKYLEDFLAFFDLNLDVVDVGYRTALKAFHKFVKASDKKELLIHALLDRNAITTQ